MFRYHGRFSRATHLCLRSRASNTRNSTPLTVRRSFTQSHFTQKKQDQPQVEPLQQEASKRSSPGKTSLRRVSIEAERSRTRLIINKAGRRFVDPGADTKKVTAYCAAEQYNIQTASRLIREDGFELDPYKTGLFPQVIHVQTPAVQRPGTFQEAASHQQQGDVFIFPSGTVVAWSVPERIVHRLVEQVLPPAAINSHSGFVEIEKEDMEFVEDGTTERSNIVGDTIIIGTKLDAQQADIDNDSSIEHTKRLSSSTQSPEVHTILAKIAFSSGLARSTKLAVLERLTDAYFESTRSIPLIMSRGTPLPVNRPVFLRRIFEMLGFGSRLPFSRPFILRKTGELLSIRAQLNLYSELTDSLPDIFWDSRHELGLEGYYDLVGRALDVGVRIKVLNEKMDYAQEIASVLRETLSERHNLRLEWGIIILIFIEVLFEFSSRVKEYRIKDEHSDTDPTVLVYASPSAGGDSES